MQYYYTLVEKVIGSTIVSFACTEHRLAIRALLINPCEIQQINEGFYFILHEKNLNVIHLCYPARRAITVCSGHDEQCEIYDLTILFHSMVNAIANIDILFSRDNTQPGQNQERSLPRTAWLSLSIMMSLI